MTEKDQAFQQKLLATFKLEAEDHLKLMSAGLLELEKTSSTETQMAIVERIFREVHSLKGAARAVSMTEIETLCQSLESVFAAWKRRELDPSPERFDVLHQTVGSLGRLLASTETAPAAAVKAPI